MSIRDGFPNKDGEYLCFQQCSGFGVYGYKVGYGFHDSKVTHWWPLPPEPYKPEGP